MIGVIAGLVVCLAVVFVERMLKVDDPVGAISVHGFNGLLGVLCVGIFADGTYGAGTNGVAGNVTGLLYGNPGQLGAQAIGALSNMIWVGTSTFVSWKITALIVNGHRVSAEVEDMGLDTPEMGLPA